MLIYKPLQHVKITDVIWIIQYTTVQDSGCDTLLLYRPKISQNLIFKLYIMQLLCIAKFSLTLTLVYKALMALVFPPADASQPFLRLAGLCQGCS